MTNQTKISEEQAPSQPMTLEETLQFDAADLEANRAGLLSETQRERFKRNWLRGLALSILLVVFGVLAATFFLFMGWRTETVVLSVVGIALTVFNAAVVGLLAQAYLRYRGDTNRAPVEQLKGTASRTLRVNERARSAAYFVNIEGQEIRVNKPVFNAFVDHGTYRVYRAPMSKQVLSAELIENSL